MSGLKILTILLLVILPFGELLRFNVGSSIYIKPLDVTAVILALWFSVWVLFIKKSQKVFSWKLLLFPVVGVLSLAVNTLWLHGIELLVATFYLVRWTSYLSILFIIPQFDKVFLQRLKTILLIDGLIIVLIGFVQYGLYSDIRNLVVIGWDDHMYRLFSTFYDPNFAGAFLALYAFFVTGYVYQSFKKKNKKEILIFLGILLATIAALLLTYSRSALLMLLLGGTILLFILKQKKLILVGLGVIILYIIVISPRFYIENTNLFRVASTEARFESYQNALYIYQNNPVVGVGFNAYRYAQQNYGFRKEVPRYPSNADAGVDNSFLFVLATTGIVGFAAYLLLWGTLIREHIASFKRRKNIFRVVFIVSAFGIFLNAFFINSLFFPAIMLWMWVLSGVTTVED